MTPSIKEPTCIVQDNLVLKLLLCLGPSLGWVAYAAKSLALLISLIIFIAVTKTLSAISCISSWISILSSSSCFLLRSSSILAFSSSSLFFFSSSSLLAFLDFFLFLFLLLISFFLWVREWFIVFFIFYS